MTKIILLEYLLKVSISMAVFYFMYSLLLQRDTFFTRNRFYLLLTCIVSLILPLAEISQYPEILLPATYPETLQIIPQGIEQVQVQFEANLSLTDYLFYLYLLGVAFFLGLFVYRCICLIGVINTSRPQRQQQYIIIPTEGRLPTFSFFSYLFWDNSQALAAGEEAQIVQHELAHIREKHSWDMVFMQLLQAVFWFNPVIYLYQRALQAQHEFLADRRVLRRFPVEPYKALLARTFLQKVLVPFSHSFNQSSIQTRLFMMNKKSSARAGLLKLTLVLPVVALLLFAFTSEAPEQIILPAEETGMPSDSIPKPSIVPFAVSSAYSGGVQPIDLQQGIRVSQLPEAIQVRAIAQTEFAAKYPKEVQYRVSEFNIHLIKGRRVVYTKSNKDDFGNISSSIKLDEVKSSIESGNRLLIEVIEVLHMNSKGQLSTVKMVPEKYMLNIAINE